LENGPQAQDTQTVERDQWRANPRQSSQNNRLPVYESKETSGPEIWKNEGNVSDQKKTDGKEPRSGILRVMKIEDPEHRRGNRGARVLLLPDKKTMRKPTRSFHRSEHIRIDQPARCVHSAIERRDRP
jgi:hypothetical protein